MHSVSNFIYSLPTLIIDRRSSIFRFHPDTNKGDAEAAEKFKEASEAYEVLSDGDSRGVYDQFGHQGIEAKNQGGSPGGGGNPFSGRGNPFGGGGGFHWESTGGQNINVEDLFGDIFGINPNAPRKGPDLQTEVTVSFMEACLHGAKKDIDLSFADSRTGRMESRSVVVNVPPGVSDGMNLRVAGQGGKGSKGGPNVSARELSSPTPNKDGVEFIRGRSLA